MTNPLRHQSRRDLLDRGLSVDEVRSARRRGALTRLARGLYVDAPAFDQLTADERYRVRIGALAARSPGLVVSHQSAAALLGLPLLTPPDHVHFTRPGRGGFRRTDELVVHPGALPDADLTVRDDILLTSAARTVVDVALTVSVYPAVVVADPRRSIAG